jgi:hypothetical protein
MADWVAIKEKGMLGLMVLETAKYTGMIASICSASGKDFHSETQHGDSITC